jgi:L-arabinose transport system ATP-binding protein
MVVPSLIREGQKYTELIHGDVMQDSTPYLSFRGIGKTFPGVKALSDISFDCHAGQVHALMGRMARVSRPC